jgi:hypothetical protein
MTALPIFGDIIANNALANGRAKWLSFFHHQKHIQDKIFPTFRLLGDIFQNIHSNRVNFKRMKNPQTEGLMARAKMIFNNIKAAMARVATCLLDNTEIQVFEFSMKARCTDLQ